MSRSSVCPFVLMLALNVGQCRVAVKINSRCPHLVRVRDRLPGSLRAGSHPEIRHSIALSLSRDEHVVFRNTNLPDASHLYSHSVSSTGQLWTSMPGIGALNTTVLDSTSYTPIVLGVDTPLRLHFFVVYLRCSVRLRVSLSLSDLQQIPLFFLF